jgi:glycosyltransferase involved in cell wall biosynthesis
MKPRVLYIASGSIREPLIVSQVVRYLKRLSGTFEACHLITLERKTIEPGDLARIQSELGDADIVWHGLPSYPGMRVVNLWREIWNGYRECLSLIRQHDLNMIHARSFIPGNIGLRLAKKTKAKFLYDMRGFWAEEKWAKGTIKQAWVRKKAQAMEDRLFHGADALVSLTHAGKNHLRDNGVETPIDVIPCCVDTDLFCPDRSVEPSGNGNRMISVGSLGPGYLAESVLGLFKAACDKDAGTSLQLLTRSTQKTIESAATAVGCDLARVNINSATPTEVPAYLNRADVGLCMIQPSVAKIASSPTKLAEYLACGIPVIANCNGIGDMVQILNDHRVGIAVEDQSPEGWSNAIEQLKQLVTDPKLAKRCRELAVNKFSVDVGVETYASIYNRLMK